MQTVKRAELLWCTPLLVGFFAQSVVVGHTEAPNFAKGDQSLVPIVPDWCTQVSQKHRASLRAAGEPEPLSWNCALHESIGPEHAIGKAKAAFCAGAVRYGSSARLDVDVRTNRRSAASSCLS